MYDTNLPVSEIFRFIWSRLCADALRQKELPPPVREVASYIGDSVKFMQVTDIPSFRTFIGDQRIPWAYGPTAVKWMRQILDFGKRFVFPSEVDGLLESSYTAYVSLQEELQACRIPEEIADHSVILTARSLIESILRDYDCEEHMALGRFAANACLGHPRRSRRLDCKLKGPVTGSSHHLKYLNKVCRLDQILRRQLSGVNCVTADRLQLSFAPKSYKSLRPIMPDTLAGSYYNSGLGRVIRYRLLNFAGLDVDRLQERHRRLAQFASADYRLNVACRLATIDMSQASDRITVPLLRCLLPPHWFELVMAGQVRHYEWASQGKLPLASACTMGLGHTFDLETLVHFALVKAVCTVLRPHSRALVSVYGDDIICPTWAVKPLNRLFSFLHLRVNEDKSYWGLSDFRESCGGDYFRGVDVRPVMPEWLTGEKVDKNRVAEFAYKTANALLTHWCPSDIRLTLDGLLRLIELIDGQVICVPPHFPESSGLKVGHSSLWSTSIDENQIQWVNAWQNVSEKSEVSLEEALYWDALRARFVSDLETRRHKVVGSGHTNKWFLVPDESLPCGSIRKIRRRGRTITRLFTDKPEGDFVRTCKPIALAKGL